MSVLVLVRHGKASAFSRTDYDQLSEPGFEQARHLGAYWAERGLVADRVYVGPRRRHVETHETAMAVLRDAGITWPEPVRMNDLDEHDGLNVVFRMLPEAAKEDPILREIAEAMARGETPTHDDALLAFRRVMRRWVRGEIEHGQHHDGIEKWTTFRARVAGALAAMTSDVGAGKKIVAFTSAGAACAAVGQVLGVGDEKVLDLSWAMHNAAFHELAFSEIGWGLRTFNATPHLKEERLITAV
jgi:broad specificity phosphatase PhoE